MEEKNIFFKYRKTICDVIDYNEDKKQNWRPDILIAMQMIITDVFYRPIKYLDKYPEGMLEEMEAMGKPELYKQLDGFEKIYTEHMDRNDWDFMHR